MANGLIIAFPALIINIICLAITFKYIFGYSQFSFQSALNLAAILGPASPGIFANKLTAMNVPAKYTTVFKIEQQFGLGLGLFICKQVLTQDTNYQSSTDLFYTILKLFGNVISSLLLGTIFALVFSKWLERAKNDQLLINVIVQVCISIQAFICQNITHPYGGFSMGLASMTLGLFMSVTGKLHISQNAAAIRLSDKRMGTQAFKEIEYACNICLDNSEQSIGIFEIIRTKFQSVPSLAFLFNFRRFSIINKLVVHSINKHIAQIYEICIMTAGSLRDIIQHLNSFKLFNSPVFEQQLDQSQYQQVKHIILQELIQEMRRIDDYMQELYYTYSSILKSMQTRIAIVLLINFAFQYIKHLKKTKLLQRHEYKRLKNKFLDKLYNLNVIKLELDLPNIEFFGIDFPLIQKLDKVELQLLQKDMIIKNFKKGEIVYKNDDYSDYVYFLIQGEIEEKLNKNVSLIKSIGHFVGYMNLINDKKCVSTATVKKDCQCQLGFIKQTFSAQIWSLNWQIYDR
ncbi:Cyclic nucleotide-binding protein [Pseudocohnilembus persalinus]|uniref:Cyclic nucleotide-binding protein n=1 Tax=Pseudocohnilembus persalinus TaxID=266149 RepID=A0A0V0R5D0_PSEPJ|nr:Cyclic nucleotide-binding protein [Pseudocohnilembus persalinus]|eukprot:KRX09702.1 Cyclic nucleotide-binding protein [Pseudocohnilembus persalinus]